MPLCSGFESLFFFKFPKLGDHCVHMHVIHVDDGNFHILTGGDVNGIYFGGKQYMKVNVKDLQQQVLLLRRCPEY